MKTFILTAMLSSVAGMAIAQEAPATRFPSGYVRSQSPIAAERIGSDGLPIPIIRDGTELNAKKVDAFNEAIDQEFLGPELTRRSREISAMNERALYERSAPQALVEEASIALEPGQTLPNLFVTKGNVTNIGFYDGSGAPWPVVGFVFGEQEAYDVQPFGGTEDEPAHNLVVVPKRGVGTTNLVVSLQGLQKPVNINLVTSDNRYNATKDVYINALGPNAIVNTATAKSIVEAGSGVLLSVLAGTGLPENAFEVDIGLDNTRAWVIGEHVYIRSKYALSAPRHESAMSDSEYRAYQIGQRSQVAFSVNNQVTFVEIALP